MKKHLITIMFVFTLFSTHSIGVDYGVTIDSFNGYNDDSSEYLFGFERASAYGSLKFSDNVSFIFDGYYKYTYKSNDDNKHIFDLNTLLFMATLGKAEIQLGRFYLSDFSGDIVTHNLDGLSMAFPLSFGTIYLNAGYSGYIHRDEYTLFKTIIDESKNRDRERVQLLIEGIDFVKDFESISIWLSAYSSQDLRSEYGLDNRTLFAGGGIRGAISSTLLYSLRGNFKTGFFPYNVDGDLENSKGAKILAGMGAFNIDWYLTGSNSSVLNALSPSISLDLGVSSGDKDLKSRKLGFTQGDIEGTSLYSPMVSTGPGVIFGIANQNLTYGKITASITPSKVFQTQVESALFFRTVEGVTGSDDVDYDSEGNYLGTEVSLSLNFRPFSDLGMSLSSGVFLPNSSVMIKSDIKWVTTAYLSLSL